MKESRNIEGRWHIFGTGHPAYLGTLEYDPETELELTVKIAEPNSPEVFPPLNPAAIPRTIWGYNKHGEPITLFGCSSGGSTLSGGLAIQKVHAIYALLGRHFSCSWKRLKFGGAYATYSSLNEWIARRAFDHKMEPDGGVSMTQTRPPDIVIPIDSKTKLTITTEGNIHFAPFSEFRLTQNHAIKITFKKRRSPRTIYGDYVLSLARLLTVFTGTRVYVTGLFFYIKTKGRPGKTRIECLTGNSGVTSAEEITASFPAIVQEWFRHQQIYEAVLNLYFATLFIESLYGPQEFLLLAQALEVYHNSNPKFTKSLQTKSQFRQRIKDILKKLPTTERDWVKEGLQHANQKTLAQRLDDLLSAHRSEARKFISRPRQFADLIRHTRNYYTHFNPDLRRKKKIATDRNMFAIILKMRALLNVCLFKDLGITGAPIDRVIRKVKDIRLITP